MLMACSQTVLTAFRSGSNLSLRQRDLILLSGGILGLMIVVVILSIQAAWTTYLQRQESTDLTRPALRRIRIIAHGLAYGLKDDVGHDVNLCFRIVRRTIIDSGYQIRHYLNILENGTNFGHIRKARAHYFGTLMFGPPGTRLCLTSNSLDLYAREQSSVYRLIVKNT